MNKNFKVSFITQQADIVGKKGLLGTGAIRKVANTIGKLNYNYMS